MVAEQMNYQQFITNHLQFRLDVHYCVKEINLSFFIFIGLSSGLIEHRNPPQTSMLLFHFS